MSTPSPKWRLKEKDLKVKFFVEKPEAKNPMREIIRLLNRPETTPPTKAVSRSCQMSELTLSRIGYSQT
jgi:hypothetical protein